MMIAVLPGDGIGREIIAEAVKVLRALERHGLKLELREAPVGGAGLDAAGDPLPAAMMLRYRLNHDAGADRIEAAVRRVLAQGLRTGDIHQAGTKKVGTGEMGDAVVAAL